MLFYSEDVHYSIQKASHLLELPTFQQIGEEKFPGQCPITGNGSWPEMVPSHDFDKDNPQSGSVKIDELKNWFIFYR